MDEPARIECPCCGHALAVPPDVREKALFACAHCGMVIRNCEGSRAFRWAHVDPYVRKNGTSRANLWGGLLGALAWLPVLALVMLLTGRFDVRILLALAGPYLALLAVLRARRPRLPAIVWSMELWAGLGAYLLYLHLLGLLMPDRMKVVYTGSAALSGPAMVLGLGGTWLAVGLAGRAWYRRRAARLPQATGTPPTV
jgi:hypothetical protein